jgi:hypothetical protein
MKILFYGWIGRQFCKFLDDKHIKAKSRADIKTSVENCINE